MPEDFIPVLGAWARDSCRTVLMPLPSTWCAGLAAMGRTARPRA